jgi:N-methylhydantoinase B
VVTLLLANTRTPEERLGDLRAQAGSNDLAGRRLIELAARLGTESLFEAMRATKDHSERLARAAIGRVPPGAIGSRTSSTGMGRAPWTFGSR